MVPVTLSVHEHRLAERTTDGSHELAQHVHALLTLKLAKVNIEVDLLEDIGRKITRTEGMGQTRRSTVSASAGRDSTSAADGSGPGTPPSKYSHRHPFDRTKSNKICQSSAEPPGTDRSGSAPISSGSKKFLTSPHTRSGIPSCCLPAHSNAAGFWAARQTLTSAEQPTKRPPA
jgi:hypothetical protein